MSHVTFVCVTWLICIHISIHESRHICMCDMTHLYTYIYKWVTSHLYVWHDSFVYTYLYMSHITFVRVTWLIYIHISINESRHICMRDVPHLYTYIYEWVTSHLYVWYDSFVYIHLYMSHVTFVCVTWLICIHISIRESRHICMCDMTHPHHP